MAAKWKPGRKVSQPRLMRMRVLVFGRDDFTCQGCGWRPSPVPSPYLGTSLSVHVDVQRGTLTQSKLLLLELDHVVPFKHGGKFVETNLQTLCNWCNARKGARMPAGARAS